MELGYHFICEVFLMILQVRGEGGGLGLVDFLVYTTDVGVCLGCSSPACPILLSPTSQETGQKNGRRGYSAVNLCLFVASQQHPRAPFPLLPHTLWIPPPPPPHHHHTTLVPPSPCCPTPFNPLLPPPPTHTNTHKPLAPLPFYAPGVPASTCAAPTSLPVTWCWPLPAGTCTWQQPSSATFTGQR